MSISSFSHQYCVLKTNTDSVQSARCGGLTGLNGNPTGGNSKARESGSFIETSILSACISENCTECRVIFIKTIAACNFISPHLLHQSLDDVHIYSK